MEIGNWQQWIHLTENNDLPWKTMENVIDINSPLTTLEPSFHGQTWTQSTIRSSFGIHMGPLNHIGKVQNGWQYCILLIIPIKLVCHKPWIENFLLWATFWSQLIFVFKVKLTLKRRIWNWVVIFYMHAKYENNCLTGSWHMSDYVFSASGDLDSKVKAGQCYMRYA